MDFRSRITIDPARRSGKPCVRELRITVGDVLEYLAAGMSKAQVLAEHPDLTPEDVDACLAFAEASSALGRTALPASHRDPARGDDPVASSAPPSSVDRGAAESGSGGGSSTS